MYTYNSTIGIDRLLVLCCEYLHYSLLENDLQLSYSNQASFLLLLNKNGLLTFR